MTNQQAEKRLDSDPMKKEDQIALSSQSGAGIYEIHVKGHLNAQWSDWLDGLQVKLLDNGEMILTGTIVDQAALMGILNKLNRLNLPLISVNEVKKDGKPGRFSWARFERNI